MKNIIKNLDSVINQTYKNWRIIYIDDASTDNTFELVKKYRSDFLDKHPVQQSQKIKILHNTNNMKQAYCRYQAYKHTKDNEIICFLDGDDWLYNNQILEKLNREYQSDIKLTYGSYYFFSEESNTTLNPNLNKLQLSIRYPQHIINNNSYRREKRWFAVPLRTGYAHLYKNMPESNYKDAKNEWMSACTDLAEFFWAIEQTNGKFKNITYPTYVYNIDASKKFENSTFNLSESQKQYRLQTREKIANYERPIRNLIQPPPQIPTTKPRNRFTGSNRNFHKHNIKQVTFPPKTF